jgi:hypothetical protein
VGAFGVKHEFEVQIGAIRRRRALNFVSASFTQVAEENHFVYAAECHISLTV